MQKKSPEKLDDQVLGILGQEKVRAFLLDCVNLPNPIDYPPHHAAYVRWRNRWARLFTFQRDGEETALPEPQLLRFAPKLRTTLCRAWAEQDARQREWLLYRLREDHHRMVVRAENKEIIDFADPGAVTKLARLVSQAKAIGGDANQQTRFVESWASDEDLLREVPKIGPFEAAVYWLQTNQKLTILCANAECPAPYFFRVEKGQKFCSPECANPSRRKAKLKWWNDSPNSPRNRPESAKPE